MFYRLQPLIPLRLLLCFPVLCFLSQDAALAQSGGVAPIEIQGGATTGRDLLQQHLIWAERVLIQPLSIRVQKEPWHDQALAFVREALPSLLLTSDYYPTGETLAAAQRLRDAGCDDPLVRLLDCIVVYAAKGGNGKGFVELPKALEIANSWPGPKALAWMIARQRASMSKSDPAEDREAQLAIELTETVMNDGSYRTDEDRLFVQHLFTPHASRLMEDNYESFAVLEGPPVLGEWVQNTMRGWLEVQRAWDRRDHPDKVGDEQKETFAAHIARATEALTRAWNLRPDRPEAATEMINASLFTDEATCRLWFDRAVAAQFDYLPAYRTFLWALRPQWVGSTERMVAFGIRCMQTDRYDTGVPGILLEAATKASADAGDWRKIYRDPAMARQIVEVSQRIADRAVGTSRERLRIEFLALNAWLAGDFATAGKARAKLTGPLSRQVADSAGLLGIADFIAELTRDLAAGADEFLRAEKLAEKEQYSEARVAYQKALAVVAANEQPRVRQRIGAIDFREKTASKDWVELPVPDSAAPMWFDVRYAGGAELRALPEEEAAKYDHPSAGFCFAAPMGDDFEVRWELPPASGRPETAAACRLMLQLAPGHALFPYTPAESPVDGVSNWFSVRVTPGSERGIVDIALIDFGGEQIGQAVSVAAKGKSRVTFRLLGEFVSLFVDEQSVIEQRAPNRVYGWPQVLIAFAASANPAERLQTIAVRIPSKPVVPPDPHEVASINP